MSYHSSKYSGDSTWSTIIICFILIFAIILGINACSAETWNEGVCPRCEVRYELRGASSGVKYYACPECGQEVQRY